MSLQKINKANFTLIFSCLFLLPAYGGDGSGASNDDLMRDSLNSNCFEIIFCSPVEENQENKIVQNGQNSNQAIMLEEEVILPAEFRQMPYYGQVEQITPSVATTYDWSVNLRGAFQKDHKGERFDIIATPEISISHENNNSQYDLGVSASLLKQLDGEFRLFGGNVDFSSNYIIDRETRASLDANLNATQLSPNDASIGSGIAQPPITVGGSANGTISRQFGRLNAELRGSISRSVSGESQLISGLWQDNSVGNNTALGAGLRVGYELTPIFTIFGDASYIRTNFDNNSAMLATSQSNNSYTFLAGIAGNWQDVLNAQVSVGSGLVQYDSALIDDVPGTMFNSSISYLNGHGAEFTASFSNNISAVDPSLGASTKIDYSTSASARYQVNDWLTARASINAGWAHYDGIDDIERTHSYGVGADYNYNRYTVFSADYLAGTLETTSLGKRENQRFEFGVTFSR